MTGKSTGKKMLQRSFPVERAKIGVVWNVIGGQRDGKRASDFFQAMSMRGAGIFKGCLRRGCEKNDKKMKIVGGFASEKGVIKIEGGNGKYSS